MVGTRLVRLVEKHSHELAVGLTAELLKSERTTDFRKIPREELQRTTAEVYCNLGEWLLRKTERDIEQRFRTLAARRAADGVALHQFVWAMTISRNYLWRFLREEAFADSVIALYDELELQQLLSQFFDRAMYYGVLGYEDRREQGRVGRDFSSLRRWIDPLSA
jgi:hypothetical protein